MRWNLVGLFVGLVGVAGVGLDKFIWAKNAALDVIPNVGALTSYGFRVPRWLYNVRRRVYWALIVLAVLLQFVGAFRARWTGR